MDNLQAYVSDRRRCHPTLREKFDLGLASFGLKLNTQPRLTLGFSGP